MGAVGEQRLHGAVVQPQLLQPVEPGPHRAQHGGTQECRTREERRPQQPRSGQLDAEGQRDANHAPCRDDRYQQLQALGPQDPPHRQRHPLEHADQQPPRQAVNEHALPAREGLGHRAPLRWSGTRTVARTPRGWLFSIVSDAPSPCRA